MGTCPALGDPVAAVSGQWIRSRTGALNAAATVCVRESATRPRRRRGGPGDRAAAAQRGCSGELAGALTAERPSWPNASDGHSTTARTFPLPVTIERTRSMPYTGVGPARFRARRGRWNCRPTRTSCRPLRSHMSCVPPRRPGRCRSARRRFAGWSCLCRCCGSSSTQCRPEPLLAIDGCRNRPTGSSPR